MKFELKGRIKRYIEISDNDYNSISGYQWYCRKVNNGYSVYTRINDKDVSINRIIYGCEKNIVLVHKNGNPLDFRRENLEKLTREEFAHKYIPRKMRSKSRYRNVLWDKCRKQWKVRVIHNQNFYDKYTDSEEDAAIIADYISFQTYGNDGNYNLSYKDQAELIEVYAKVISKYGDNKKSIRQNASQGQKKEGTYSKYIGVSKDKRRGTWTAKIKKNGRTKWLGSFSNEVEAAKAYDSAAIELYGAAATLNFK